MIITSNSTENDNELNLKYSILQRKFKQATERELRYQVGIQILTEAFSLSITEAFSLSEQLVSSEIWSFRCLCFDWSFSSVSFGIF